MSRKQRSLKQYSDDLAHKEVEKLMPIIHDAKYLKPIPNNFDKTPASIQKFSSKNSGASFKYLLDKQNGINVNKNKLKENMSDEIRQNIIK